MTLPDIILILSDNQQAATLGCYGNADAHTPHLDALAAQGIRFDNAFCPNAFCSPCRASVMTGQMPSWHGVHSWIDDRRAADWPADWHALRGTPTLPEHLQKAGYRTGHFGKYHLGVTNTPAPGWDSWVTMEDGHVRSFYDNRIEDNGETYACPSHTVPFFAEKALEFLDGDGPSFAYLPLPAPYGHWPATRDARRNDFATLYDDCTFDSIQRPAISKEALAHYDRVKGESGGGLDYSMLMRAPNDVPTLRNYFSQISLIDDIVGQIAAAHPDAIIIYTADHGLSLGQHGFWGHGAATLPSNLHLAAQSVPLILRVPGRKPQIRSEHVSNMDLFATLLDLAGALCPATVASRSLVPMLDGAGWRDETYGEQEETRVIRTGHWAYVKRHGDFDDALYDTRADPQETTNIAADHPEICKDLSARIDAFFANHSRPEADLWQGGTAIQNVSMGAYWKATHGADWAPVYTH